MGRGLYSSGHDRNKKPEKKKSKRKAANRNTKIVGGNSTSPKAEGPELPQPSMSSDKRAKLRRQQMMQGRAAVDLVRGEPNIDEVPDVRREYTDQEGYTNHSEPRHMAPRMDQRTQRTLPDQDIQDDPDLRLAGYPVYEGEEGLERYAAIDTNSGSLVSVDNQISAVYNALSSLSAAADSLVREANQQNDAQGVEQQHHAERITWIVSEALIPWLGEIEGHLEGLLQASPEGQFILEDEDEDIL
jgi:hypothetical protein